MPLARWTHYQQTRAQKEKALYLLALSGVVRPSTIELRYTISLSHISAEPLCEEQPPIPQDASTPPTSSAETTHLAHHLYSTAFSFFDKSRRHIQSLQWDTRNAIQPD